MFSNRCYSLFVEQAKIIWKFQIMRAASGSNRLKASFLKHKKK